VSVRPSTMSKLSSSARPAPTSGRYHPRGGGGRRIRRRASRAPRPSRMRPIVRTDGTTAWPRATSSRWMARAPYSPRSLVSFSSRRQTSTRSSTADSVRRTRRGIGERSLQSTRSRGKSPARRHHHCTVKSRTSCARATDRIEAPARTSATIVRRFSSRRPRVFYPLLPPPRFSPSIIVTKRCWHLSDQQAVTPGPQSENNSGGQAAIERRIESLRGRVVRQAQDVAAADAGQMAGAGDEQEAQGAHASDQVRIGAFPRPRFGLGASPSGWTKVQ
jgi:hypothetical protein